MANNKEQTTARDYIKSFVKDTNTEEFLKQEQPHYVPTQLLQSPPTPIIEQDKASTNPVPAPNHYSLHSPTQNPIPSNEHDHQEKESQPQVVWTSHDIKEQRNEIHEASLILCADLHEDLFTCFKHGSWWDKAKMCEEQKQKFWNCYNAQKQFLREVNYKGPGITDDENQHILSKAYQLRDKIDQQQQTAQQK
ncbi:uncharacterized protein BX663DRAFT_475347 [Cokeromyces recurvatus]|uniref:uncharacterized protein n=1 Tax=Cokeromyces recurvatus TaxID=90255 RepID=UPI0022203254|nr:uncharacterized protein BX663DRAFT_475347 [Cokeromyces recurvatus]KAI7901502.1 hypothetical protein BX663DRAFT_475347 [Cokeromyces recurvatus]